MSGEHLQQARIRADLARQTAEQSHMSAQEIAASYEPQIAALDLPRRISTCPD